MYIFIHLCMYLCICICVYIYRYRLIGYNIEWDIFHFLTANNEQVAGSKLPTPVASSLITNLEGWAIRTAGPTSSLSTNPQVNGALQLRINRYG